MTKTKKESEETVQGDQGKELTGGIQEGKSVLKKRIVTTNDLRSSKQKSTKTVLLQTHHLTNECIEDRLKGVKK